MIYSIAVLITCHNRKDLTLNSLKMLYNQGYVISIYLVDDGSNDGTSDAIKSLYPEVNLILGDGDLFWNRGMHLAWKTASKKDYDYYFWLNDDTVLKDDCLRNMIKLCHELGDNSIICGAVQDDKSLDFTYGGKDISYQPIFPDGSIQHVVYINGNIVLIPRYVFRKVGLLDPIFNHDLGDYDYGLRARKLGINIYTTLDYVGFCQKNLSLLSKGRKMGVSLRARLKRLYSPFGYHPNQQFVYAFRHYGLLKAVWIYTKLHFINIVSDKFYKRFINKNAVFSKKL